MMAADKHNVQNDIERGYRLVWEIHQQAQSQSHETTDSVQGKKLSASHHVIVGSNSASVPAPPPTITTISTKNATSSLSLKMFMIEATEAQKNHDCASVETIIGESCKLGLLRCSSNWNSPLSTDTFQMLDVLSTYLPSGFRQHDK